MECAKFTDQEAFLNYLSDRWPERGAVERILSELVRLKKEYELTAICDVCGVSSRLRVTWPSDPAEERPNFREGLICFSCKLNSRQRFVYQWVNRWRVDQKGFDCYVMEQVTPFFRYLEERKNADWRVVGSEYLGPNMESGTYTGGIRHEDIERLSFDDQSFDAVVSNDVFEHVPDARQAFSECFRILKPEGRLVFTIPFFYKNADTHDRAVLHDNKIVHLAPTVYHGNPLSPDGSLVFHDFGWDVLKWCRDAGFRDAYIIGYYSLAHGYVGDGIQSLFVADK